jgi:hypothetical protein
VERVERRRRSDNASTPRLGHESWHPATSSFAATRYNRKLWMVNRQSRRRTLGVGQGKLFRVARFVVKSWNASNAAAAQTTPAHHDSRTSRGTRRIAAEVRQTLDPAEHQSIESFPLGEGKAEPFTTRPDITPVGKAVDMLLRA